MRRRCDDGRVNGSVIGGISTSGVQLGKRKKTTRELCDVIVFGELPGIAGAECVLAAKQVEGFGDVALEALALAVVRLRETETLGIELSALIRQTIDLRIVLNLGDVEERFLMEIVPAPGERAVHEQALAKDAVIPHRPVPRTIIPRGVRGLVVRSQCGIWSVVGVRR